MNKQHPYETRGLPSGRRLAALVRPLACLTLAVFASGLASDARAAQYYFSATGNDDTGNGSQSNPWRSLAKASSLTNLTGGDQVLFKRGDVWTGETLTVRGSGSPGSPIIFGAYSSGALPIIDHNVTTGGCIVVANKSYITIQDIEVRQGQVAADMQHCHHMTVQRITARDAGAIGILVRGGFENHVLDCTAISNGQAGIFFKGDANDHLHDSSIQRCFIDGDNGDTNDGIALHEAQGPSENLGQNFLVKDNVSIHCGEQGYDITSGSNIVLENNKSQENEEGAFSFGHTASDVTVRYHQSVNEPTQRVANLKVGAPNVTVEYSTFISHPTAVDSQNGGAIPMVWVTSTTGAEHPEVQPENLTLRNNVFVWNHATSGGDFFKLKKGAYALNISKLTIKNNIFVSRTSQGGVMRFAEALFPPNHTGFDIDNNLYYGSTATQWVVGSSSYDFAGYRSTFGKDTNGVQADPQFENIANGDFRLSSTASRAYNAGQNIGISTDPLGVSIPQGGARDIGAFELPVTGAPAAPTGLTASNPTSSTITLSWVDNSSPPNGETGFEIDRATNSAFTAGLVVNAYLPPTDATSWLADGLSPSTTYFFRIRATNSNIDSADSNTASAMTTGGGGTTVAFTSAGANDGWVLESGETTGVGGSINSTDATTSALRVGDDASKRQYRVILSFNTSSIPDTATVTSATLRIKRGTQSGTVTGLGALYADAKTYNFNSNGALETADFNAAATTTQAVTLSIPTSNGVLASGNLTAAALGAINKTGNTQFRVYFAIDDNNNTTADYIGFHSGDDATPANRPVLEVTYQ